MSYSLCRSLICSLLGMALLFATAAVHAAQPEVLLSLNQPSSAHTLNAVDRFSPTHGTAEFWFTLDFDPATVTSNQNLLEVRFGKTDSLGLYFNAVEKALVFYMRDADNPRPDFHSAEYPVFINTGPIDWHHGQRHHIAITWSPEVSRLYLDGSAYRWSYYHGGMAVSPDQSGEIVIGRGRFNVDAARIWSQPRAPRRINRMPSPRDVQPPRFPATASNWPATAATHRAGRLLLATTTDHQPAALAIDDTATNWLWQPARITTHPSLTATWQKITTRDEALVLALDLTNPTDAAVTTDLTLTLPLLHPNMHAFLAADDCPFPLEEGRPFYDHTRRATFGKDTQLPLVTLYQPAADRGLTITSGDQTFENVTYDLAMESRATDLQITHHDLTVAPGATRTLRWYLIAHAGDWRPGLAAYASLFPAILNAPQGPITRGPQGMIIGGPSTPEFLADLNNLRVGWREVSLYLGEGAGFGNYIPDDLTPYEKTVASYRRDVAAMNQHDIAPLFYIQARECKDVDRANSEFADSVVRLTDGSPLVNQYGPFGASMTCRPGTAWFNHLLEQAHRELATFPNAKGFFFDNAWHTEYAAIMCAIADIAHAQNKSLASNGANAMSVGHTDSIMAESYFTALGSLQYLGLVTPVTYIPIYGTGLIDHPERELAAPGLPANLARDLRHCLVSGAFYSFNYRGARHWSDASRDLYQRYLPLQELLSGRTWLLHAHALTLPVNLRGNIFQQPDNNWCITLVDPAADPTTGVSTPVDAPIRVQLPDDSRTLQAATLIDLRTADPQPVRFQQRGRTIELHPESFHAMAAITLTFSTSNQP